jgi:hypothetical protein
MVVPFILVTVIAVGSTILCYNHESQKTYERLEEEFGKEIDTMSLPEKEGFLLQKFISENKKQSVGVTPSITDPRYSGHKRFAKEHGVDLGRILKQYEMDILKPEPA